MAKGAMSPHSLVYLLRALSRPYTLGRFFFQFYEGSPDVRPLHSLPIPPASPLTIGGFRFLTQRLVVMTHQTPWARAA